MAYGKVWQWDQAQHAWGIVSTPESVVEPHLTSSWEPIVHISFQLCIHWRYLRSLESTTVEAFALWKLANTTGQSSSFSPPVSQFPSTPSPADRLGLDFKGPWAAGPGHVLFILFVVRLQKDGLNLPDPRKTCILEPTKPRIWVSKKSQTSHHSIFM